MTTPMIIAMTMRGASSLSSHDKSRKGDSVGVSAGRGVSNTRSTDWKRHHRKVSARRRDSWAVALEAAHPSRQVCRWISPAPSLRLFHFRSLLCRPWLSGEILTIGAAYFNTCLGQSEWTCRL